MIYHQQGLVGQIRSVMSNVLCVKEDRIKRVCVVATSGYVYIVGRGSELYQRVCV